jgi:hypothetical protein
MEVDHFNPTLVGPQRHKYDNLFLATRHCNGSKSNIWPTKKDRKKGIHLINPCKELDYGLHIFEHPETHRLIGITPAGDFHITTCDLNAPHLVVERYERAAIHDLLNDTPFLLKSLFWEMPREETSKRGYLDLLRGQFEKMIPIIPYLPKDHPKYNDEIELMKALCALSLL